VSGSGLTRVLQPLVDLGSPSPLRNVCGTCCGWRIWALSMGGTCTSKLPSVHGLLSGESYQYALLTTGTGLMKLFGYFDIVRLKIINPMTLNS